MQYESTSSYDGVALCVGEAIFELLAPSRGASTVRPLAGSFYTGVAKGLIEGLMQVQWSPLPFPASRCIDASSSVFFRVFRGSKVPGGVNSTILALKICRLAVYRLKHVQQHLKGDWNRSRLRVSTRVFPFFACNDLTRLLV